MCCLQKSFVYKWDGAAGTTMRKLDEVKVELPRNTVVEAEIVQELRGEVPVPVPAASSTKR